MKKSQILAALALAFALGVVVPVANTSAYVTKNSGATTVSAEDEIYQNATNELSYAGDLEDIDEYAQLFMTLEKFDGTDGMLKWYSEWATTENNAWNLHFGKPGNDTIKYINDAKGYIGNAAFKNAVKTGYEAYAKMQDVSISTSGYRDLASTYKAIVAARKAAQANVDTITANYNKDGSNPNDVVGLAQQEYRNIVIDLDNALRAIESSLGNYVSNHSNEIRLVNGSVADTVAALENDIKEIDFDAYRNLVNSQEYTEQVGNSATGNLGNLTLAKKMGMIANTARGLSKYGLAGEVVKAAYNVESVNSTTRSVDYDRAQEYIATLKTAIKNYRDGKTDNSGTGEGTNKPGDDNKDPNAPDTGILADGEANASTTVAMVAGIATALTAAGAGVVAYRNARRSTRK